MIKGTHRRSITDHELLAIPKVITSNLKIISNVYDDFKSDRPFHHGWIILDKLC